VDAYAHHETRLADFYRKRFRGEFRPAVAAWVATRPLRDANAPAGWRPAYPDYLYLAYTNATAFSPTDTLPVRRWAKLTMMVQSTMSLVIAILVIARAINVLPG
jgi:uncharacterized membrane protein